MYVYIYIVIKTNCQNSVQRNSFNKKFIFIYLEIQMLKIFSHVGRQ